MEKIINALLALEIGVEIVALGQVIRLFCACSREILPSIECLKTTLICKINTLYAFIFMHAILMHYNMCY